MSETDTSLDNLKFLGESPLVQGESKEDYFALLKVVRDYMRPVILFDHIRVRELADDIWEEKRYKNYQSNLIDSGFHEAFLKTLTRIHQNDEWQARKDADRWFRGTPEERGAIADLLKQFGVSIDMLHAEAMALNAGKLAVLERLIGNRKSSRAKTTRERNKELDLHAAGSIVDE